MGRDFTPRYYEIEQELRDLISRSRPGDPLPSENELAETFSVSRMTARHAMQRLVQDELIYRLPGHGSFVANSAMHREASRLRSFSTQMRLAGHEPSSVVLLAEERPATDEERASLRLTRNSTVVAINRVRLSNGIPVVRERAALTPRCRVLLDQDLSTASVHALLHDQGFRLEHGRATLSAEVATSEDAEQLEVAVGSPILVERRLILDANDRPVEYTTSRYVGRRYKLDVTFDVEDPSTG